MTEAPHPMRRIRIDKIIVNIGVGKSGEPLEKARKVLDQITGQKSAPRKAKGTIKDWGVRQGEPIGCAVTLRRQRAHEFLKRALEPLDNKLKPSSFDNFGNFSFGIKEHIEIPGTKYVPEIGIYGMNVSVTLERPGYRVKRRTIRQAKIGHRHLITKEEAIQFMKDNFGTQISTE